MEPCTLCSFLLRIVPAPEKGRRGPWSPEANPPFPSRKGSDPTPLAGSPELTQDTFQTWEGGGGRKEGWKPGQRANSWALTGFHMVWKCQVFKGSAIFTTTLLPAHLRLTPPKELAQHSLPPGSLPGLTPPHTAWHHFASSMREGGETKTQHCIHSQLGAYTSQRAWSAFHLLHKCLKMTL